MASSSVFNIPDPPDKICLIGCGGTGAILAEHLCRMIAGFKLECELVIYDGDTVEQNNIKRQNFFPYEIGINKAAAMATRLAGQFALKVSFSEKYFSKDTYLSGSVLMITATDSLASRKIVADRNESDGDYWLDVGNELYHGQAVFGTTHDKNILKKMYCRLTKFELPARLIAGGEIDLPDIAALNPKILTAKKTTAKTSCVDAPFLKQGFAVNEMAALAGAIIAKQILVDRQVKYSGIYFNVSDGRMQPRMIDKSLFAAWSK